MLSLLSRPQDFPVEGRYCKRNGRNICCVLSMWLVIINILFLTLGSLDYSVHYCYRKYGKFFHDVGNSSIRIATNERNQSCLPCGYMKETSLSKHLNKYDVSECELVISTVLFKGYDEFKPLSKGFDVFPDECYYVFTDSKSRYNVSRGYTHVYVNISADDIPYDDGARLTKIFKIIPQRVFRNLKWHVYIAGKTILKKNYAWLLNEFRSSKQSIIIAEKHPRRTDVYKEGRIVIWMKKDIPEIVNKQLQDYELQGYPKNFGLLDAAFLFRDFRSRDVQLMSCTWFDEVNRGSRRDQLSFNYVVWKLGLEVKYYPARYFQRSTGHTYHLTITSEDTPMRNTSFGKFNNRTL